MLLEQMSAVECYKACWYDSDLKLSRWTVPFLHFTMLIVSLDVLVCVCGWVMCLQTYMWLTNFLLDIRACNFLVQLQLTKWRTSSIFCSSNPNYVLLCSMSKNSFEGVVYENAKEHQYSQYMFCIYNFGICWSWRFMATVWQPKWIVVIYS